MHKAALLLIFVLGLSAVLWGISDLENALDDHVRTCIGLAKLGVGSVLATLAIGFGGLLNAISAQQNRRTGVSLTLLPTWPLRRRK